MGRIERVQRVEKNLYQFHPLGRNTETDRLTAEFLFSQAHDAQASGDTQKALTLYHRAISYDQSHKAAWVNAGVIWFARKDFSLAEECFTNALRIDTRYAIGCFNLALVFSEQGRIREAIQQYLETIAIQPSYADAHFNLAQIYEVIGERIEALKHSKIYLSYRGSTDDFGLSARERIRRLSGDMKVVSMNRAPAAAAVATDRRRIARGVQ